MTKQELSTRKAEIESIINSLPYISTVDSDGETNEDKYQEKLEQNEYKDELYHELDGIDNLLTSEEQYLEYQMINAQRDVQNN